jgi:hypothetical protein
VPDVFITELQNNRPTDESASGPLTCRQSARLERTQYAI